MEDNSRGANNSPEKASEGAADKQGPSRSGQQIAQMLKVLKENPYKRHVRLSKNSCVHCGMCAEACHFYLSLEDPEQIPARKAEKLTDIYRRHVSPTGKLLPFLGKAETLNDQKIDELWRTAFENCSLCGRCSLSCPMGLSTKKNMYAARDMFSSIGELPSGLDEPVETAIRTGNYIGMSTEDFVENIEWTGEEFADEMEIEEFTVPIDKEGAERLYIPHPLEVRDYPLLLMATMKILHAADEDYTFSSHCFDVSNYAYYQGNRENTAKIAKRMLDAREKIQARSILLTPCGHGYRVMRWEAEHLLDTKFTFPVLTMAELLDRLIGSGRIQVEKDTVQGPITYHDPCNIARQGGVIQEPRRILGALTSNYVEMEPHGVRNFCCGGGGGLSATGDFGQTRVKAGKVKVDQIRQTGAKVVVTGCYNCMTQIKELDRAYKLGVEVKSIVEMVAESLKA